MVMSGQLCAVTAVLLQTEAPVHVGFQAVYTPDPVWTFWEGGKIVASDHSAGSMVII
jgi:hypothetical protein